MKKFNLIFLLFPLLYSLKGNTQSTGNTNAIDSFVIINSSKIYYHQKGDGKVPVVFVSGLGEDHNTWQTVQDSISISAMTISYDRAGLGKSDYKNEKKDILSMAHELNKIIKLIKVPKPFILVGHSLGCQIVKEYASLYADKIKAIVFIDPGYNEEILKTKVTDPMWQKREQALLQYLPEFNSAQKEELKYSNKDAAISDSIRLDTKIPIILFTATRINPEFPCSKEELEVKEESHNLWLKGMPQAIHKIVPDSRHYVQNDQPLLVIKAILSFL